MPDPAENGQNPEAEQQPIEYWQGILHSKGALFLVSCLPKGDHILGGKAVHSERHDEAVVATINKATILPNSLNEIAGVMLGTILGITNKEYLGRRLRYTDIVAVSDIKEQYPSIPIDKEVQNKMFGVVITSSPEEYPSLFVSCLMLFPKEYFNDLISQIKKDPLLIRHLTAKEIPELDTLAPRQKAKRVILTVNVKTPRSLLHTKLNKTFEIAPKN